MKFTPKSREELGAMNQFKPGIYQFMVAGAKDKTSRNGRDMIELNLQVFDNDGKSTFVFDYLLEAMPVKLYSFCEVTNMLNFYKQGSLTADDCIGKSAYVELIIEKGAPNPQGGDYPDKNVVKRYMLSSATQSKPHETRPEQAPFDDEIPF